MSINLKSLRAHAWLFSRNFVYDFQQENFLDENRKNEKWRLYRNCSAPLLYYRVSMLIRRKETSGGCYKSRQYFFHLIFKIVEGMEF